MEAVPARRRPATSTKFHAFTNEEADKAYAKSGLVNSTTSADEGERPPLFDLPDEEAAEQPDFTDEQPQQPKQPHQDGGVDYAALLRQCAVSPTEDIGEPPVCVSVKTDTGTSVLGTLGNISVCIGKAKSRKTTAVGAVIAAALSPGEPQLNRFVGHADKDRNTVLYIDTEQGGIMYNDA